MPFYEYQCKSCGRELEAMQKVSDPPMKKCPHCGKSQLQRLMSAPVFRLKGGGWYETDFKGDKDNKRNLADRPEAEASKEADSSSAAKPDAKAGDSKPGETKSAESKTSDSGSGERSEGKKSPEIKSPPNKATRRSAKPTAKRASAKQPGRPKKSPAKGARKRR